MFFLYPYIKKVKGGGGEVGLIQEWWLFDILAFKVGTFFWGSYSNCLKCGKVNIKVLYMIQA